MVKTAADYFVDMASKVCPLHSLIIFIKHHFNNISIRHIISKWEVISMHVVFYPTNERTKREKMAGKEKRETRRDAVVAIDICIQQDIIRFTCRTR